MINAGKYNKRIKIYRSKIVTDFQGFQHEVLTLILQPYASVKTTKGMTIIRNGSDFEKAFTNFTIRYPVTLINRDMIIEFNGKQYTIEYLNDIDEMHVELEMQCREITH